MQSRNLINEILHNPPSPHFLQLQYLIQRNKINVITRINSLRDSEYQVGAGLGATEERRIFYIVN